MHKMKREELIRTLRTSQQQVIALLKSMIHVQDWQPEPAEWSFRYVAAHLVQEERDYYFRRIQQVATGTNPHFDGFIDTYLNLGTEELNDSLRAWSAIRQELLHFVHSLSETDLQHTGVHESIGVITIIDILEDLLRRDQGQADHIARLIEDFYDRQSSTKLH